MSVGVYIKGMEMPTFRDAYVAIVIYGNGTIRSVHGYVIDGATAVPVPSHGRLIDADALIKKIPVVSYEIYENTRALLENAPTIIPATK